MGGRGLLSYYPASQNLLIHIKGRRTMTKSGLDEPKNLLKVRFVSYGVEAVEGSFYVSIEISDGRNPSGGKLRA